MKRELALSAIALVISVLLSSPSLAQTATKPVNATPVPAAIAAALPATQEEVSLDDAILMASTPQERAALIRRCAGPPPRFVAPVVAEAPASEPAVLSE